MRENGSRRRSLEMSRLQRCPQHPVASQLTPQALRYPQPSGMEAPAQIPPAEPQQATSFSSSTRLAQPFVLKTPAALTPAPAALTSKQVVTPGSACPQQVQRAWLDSIRFDSESDSNSVASRSRSVASTIPLPSADSPALHTRLTSSDYEHSPLFPEGQLFMSSRLAPSPLRTPTLVTEGGIPRAPSSPASGPGRWTGSPEALCRLARCPNTAPAKVRNLSESILLVDVEVPLFLGVEDGSEDEDVDHYEDDRHYAADASGDSEADDSQVEMWTALDIDVDLSQIDALGTRRSIGDARSPESAAAVVLGTPRKQKAARLTVNADKLLTTASIQTWSPLADIADETLAAADAILCSEAPTPHAAAREREHKASTPPHAASQPSSGTPLSNIPINLSSNGSTRRKPKPRHTVWPPPPTSTPPAISPMPPPRGVHKGKRIEEAHKWVGTSSLHTEKMRLTYEEAVKVMRAGRAELTSTDTATMRARAAERAAERAAVDPPPSVVCGHRGGAPNPRVARSSSLPEAGAVTAAMQRGPAPGTILSLWPAPSRDAQTSPMHLDPLAGSVESINGLGRAASAPAKGSSAPPQPRDQPTNGKSLRRSQPFWATEPSRAKTAAPADKPVSPFSALTTPSRLTQNIDPAVPGAQTVAALEMVLVKYSQLLETTCRQLEKQKGEIERMRHMAPVAEAQRPVLQQIPQMPPPPNMMQFNCSFAVRKPTFNARRKQLDSSSLDRSASMR